MMDCGPACLSMIAKYYGKYYSVQLTCSLKKNYEFNDVLKSIGESKRQYKTNELASRLMLLTLQLALSHL